MGIKAGNFIIGGVEDPSVPQPIPTPTAKADRVRVTNLAELRGGLTTQPVSRIKREPVVREDPAPAQEPAPTKTKKKKVSKYLSDMYDTADLPSFDEEDK